MLGMSFLQPKGVNIHDTCFQRNRPLCWMYVLWYIQTRASPKGNSELIFIILTTFKFCLCSWTHFQPLTTFKFCPCSTTMWTHFQHLTTFKLCLCSTTMDWLEIGVWMSKGVICHLRIIWPCQILGWNPHTRGGIMIEVFISNSRTT